MDEKDIDAYFDSLYDEDGHWKLPENAPFYDRWIWKFSKWLTKQSTAQRVRFGLLYFLLTAVPLSLLWAWHVAGKFGWR